LLKTPRFVTSCLDCTCQRDDVDSQKGVTTSQDIDIGIMLGYGHTTRLLETVNLVGLDTKLGIHKTTKDPKRVPYVYLFSLLIMDTYGDPSIKPGSKGGIHEYFSQEKATQVLKRLGIVNSYLIKLKYN